VCVQCEGCVSSMRPVCVCVCVCVCLVWGLCLSSVRTVCVQSEDCVSSMRPVCV